MKLLTTSLGKIIVAASAVIIVLTFISLVFLPKVQEFAGGVLPDEKNYLINNNSDAFTLFCTEDVYELLKDDVVDIFSGVTALSSEGEDLVPMLREDYEKPLEEREHVFVYKINSDGTATPETAINSTVVGDWSVLYVLKDGLERTTLKVDYVFLD